ncbi:MAG: ATPase domain-containing protein [Methanocellales archaeon]
MYPRKRPIHTTLSPEAYAIIQKYEKELGNMSSVLEKALRDLDKTRYKAKLGIKEFDKILRRKKTGIIGFDDLIEGGIPESFIIVVTGIPGSGKTTFAMQFLINGAENGERGLLFSFEESAEQLAKHCLRFGWDVGKYIERGMLEVFGLSMLTIEEIIDILETYKPSRVVFDSINVLSDLESFRRTHSWRNLYRTLKQRGITSIIVTEKQSGLDNIHFDDFDFMADGLIFLDKKIDLEKEEFLLAILKMRATNVKSTPVNFKFTKNGIEIYGEPSVSRFLKQNI